MFTLCFYGLNHHGYFDQSCFLLVKIMVFNTLALDFKIEPIQAMKTDAKVGGF